MRIVHCLDSLLGSHFKCLGLLFFAALLLKVLSSLQTRCGRGGCAGLPGRSSDVADALGVLEHSGDLLKRLTSCFCEHEEDVDPHGNAEDTEDDVSLPSDVDESRRDEIAQCLERILAQSDG
jgi:hypothetical protein